MKLRRSIKRLPRPLSSRLLLLKAKKDPRQMECWLILLLLRRLQSAERPARHFRKRRHCFVFSCTCRSMPFCIRLAGLGTQNLLSGSIAPYRGLQAETHMLIFTCKSYAERMRKSFRHVSPPLCRSPTNGCSLQPFKIVPLKESITRLLTATCYPALEEPSISARGLTTYAMNTWFDAR